MSDDRRFSESEIREVFERAAREQEQAVRRTATEGLTLAEMQEVAASAGIEPAFVAAAAQSVALGESEQGRLSLGPIPRGAYRTELLPGPPTDALWEHLVADLRRTFEAQGKVHEAGRLREWRNGNLRATLEPAGEGSRLHLRTHRTDWTQLTATAAVLALVALLLALFSSTNIGSDPETLRASLAVALGSSLGAAGLWAGQRSWASTRERQMEAVAERAHGAARGGLAGAGPSGSIPEPRLDATLLDGDAGEEEAGATVRQRARH